MGAGLCSLYAEFSILRFVISRFECIFLLYCELSHCKTKLYNFYNGKKGGICTKNARERGFRYKNAK